MYFGGYFIRNWIWLAAYLTMADLARLWILVRYTVSVRFQYLDRFLSVFCAESTQSTHLLQEFYP